MYIYSNQNQEISSPSLNKNYILPALQTFVIRQSHLAGDSLYHRTLWFTLHKYGICYDLKSRVVEIKMGWFDKNLANILHNEILAKSHHTSMAKIR